MMSNLKATFLLYVTICLVMIQGTWSKQFMGDPGALGDRGSLDDLSLAFKGHEEDEVLSRKKRVITFPANSILTISNKFTIPAFSKKNGGIKGVFKGTIHIRYTFPHVLAIGKRSIENDRFETYESIINMLDSFGMSGSECIHRLVCQMAERPVDEYGVLGEVLKLLLTPTHNMENSHTVLRTFIEAENLGHRNGTCYDSYAECPLDLEQILDTGTALVKNSVRSAMSMKRNRLNKEL